MSFVLRFYCMQTSPQRIGGSQHCWHCPTQYLHPVLATRRSGTLEIDSPAKLMVLLPMEALDNAWYGPWKSLTNLTQTFKRVIFPPFFFRAIPTYGILLYAMTYSILLYTITYGILPYAICTVCRDIKNPPFNLLLRGSLTLAQLQTWFCIEQHFSFIVVSSSFCPVFLCKEHYTKGCELAQALGHVGRRMKFSMRAWEWPRVRLTPEVWDLVGLLLDTLPQGCLGLVSWAGPTFPSNFTNTVAAGC